MHASCSVALSRWSVPKLLFVDIDGFDVFGCVKEVPSGMLDR